MRRRVGGIRGAVAAVVFAAAIVAVNVWAHSSEAQVDLSAADRFSLTEETREIVRAVDDDLRISVFLSLEGGAVRDARFLLGRYEELNGRVDYRIVDPDQQPGEARRLGVSEYSTVVLEYRGRRVDAPSVDEVQISSAILRLLRGETRTACVVVGHGEGSLDDDSQTGLAKVGEALERNAYEAVPLDLAREQAVPETCEVVLLVGPRVPLLEDEVAAVVDYGRRGGRLLVAASLFSQADFNTLLGEWGINFFPGLVVDEDRSEGFDVSNVIVEHFPTANPIVQGVPRLQFPATGALVTTADPEEGLSISQLAATSDASFAEFRPDDELAFTPGEDMAGPLVVAAAADDSRIEDDADRRLGDDGRPGIVRTRVVVTANAEWLSNAFLDQLGNRRFFLNSLAWLAEEEQVLTSPDLVNDVRPLPWTPERQRTVVAITVFAVPGAMLLVGVGVWLVVRRRERRPA